MRRRIAWIAGPVALGALALIAYSLRQPSREPIEIPVASEPVAPAPARAPASVPKARPAVAAERFHHSYFQRTMLDIPIVKELYHKVSAELPGGPASELLAMYVAEGPARNDGPEFARFMSAMHEEIRSRSTELAAMIDSQDAVLKQDPFVYQMTLNLVFQLQVSPEEKAHLYGNAMTIHFAKDDKGGVTMMTANMTNAFILMKNSGVTLEQAAPYIRKGLATNFDDPEAVREFVARANAYYPGAI